MKIEDIEKRFYYYKNINDYEEIEIRIEKVMEKWTPLNQLSNTDFVYKNDIIHRSIISSEIVIDLDKPTIEENKKILLKYCEILEKNKIKYYVYYSGGKGFHIHIFFKNYIKHFTEEQKKQIMCLEVKDRFIVIKKGILEYLNINLKDIDLKIVITPRKLIRAEGSKHNMGYYKTFLGANKGEIKAKLKTFQYKDRFYLDNIKIKVKLNDISKDMSIYLIKKLNYKIKKLIEKKRKEALDSIRPTKQKGLRPLVSYLINKPLQDGRKIVLFIIIRELIINEKNKEKIKKLITKWNKLNHTKGSLSESYINLQIEDAIKRKVRPLRSKTLQMYLEEIKFKK